MKLVEQQQLATAKYILLNGAILDVLEYRDNKRNLNKNDAIIKTNDVRGISQLFSWKFLIKNNTEILTKEENPEYFL